VGLFLQVSFCLSFFCWSLCTCIQVSLHMYLGLFGHICQDTCVLIQVVGHGNLPGLFLLFLWVSFCRAFSVGLFAHVYRSLYICTWVSFDIFDTCVLIQVVGHGNLRGSDLLSLLSVCRSLLAVCWSLLSGCWYLL